MEQNQEKLILTQTAIATYNSCQCKYYLKYVERLNRPGRSIAALSGKLGHSALESIYKTDGTDKVHGVIESKCAEYFLDIGNNNKFMQVYDRIANARDTMTDVMDRYCKEYRQCGGNDFEAIYAKIDGKLVLAVEIPFRIPITTPGRYAHQSCELAGLVDLLSSHNGEVIVVDHKFKRVISETLQEDLQMSFQMKTYALAIRVYLGIPIRTVCWNVLLDKVPGRPFINKDGTVSLKKIDTTLEIYDAVLKSQNEILLREKGKGLDMEKYEKERERLSRIKWFERFFCTYPESELRLTQKAIFSAASNIQAHAKLDAEDYYKNNQMCSIFGKCGYRGLCIGSAGFDDFEVGESGHSELPKYIPLQRAWKGFRIEDGQQSGISVRGFEDAFDSVG